MESVKKTGKAVVVHESMVNAGVGAEVAASIQEQAFLRLEAPVKRIAGWSTHMGLAFERFNIPKMNVALVGSTGFVGSHILTTLLSQPSISTVHAFSRKPLSASDPSSKLHPIPEPDSSKWPSLYPASTTLFLSALGTTRAAAGGFANQRKIDHDLNVSLAHAASTSGGVSTYVLISSSGASASSPIGYARMKGETEVAVSELGFEHVVILRPGLIAGERKESRPAEMV
ncbi:MAG: hypothetical protein Q9157_009180, partial [Trypethelium eluteriae]